MAICNFGICPTFSPGSADVLKNKIALFTELGKQPAGLEKETNTSRGPGMLEITRGR